MNARLEEFEVKDCIVIESEPEFHALDDLKADFMGQIPDGTERLIRTRNYLFCQTNTDLTPDLPKSEIFYCLPDWLPANEIAEIKNALAYGFNFIETDSVILVNEAKNVQAYEQYIENADIETLSRLPVYALADVMGLTPELIELVHGHEEIGYSLMRNTKAFKDLPDILSCYAFEEVLPYTFLACADDWVIFNK